MNYDKDINEVMTLSPFFLKRLLQHMVILLLKLGLIFCIRQVILKIDIPSMKERRSNTN